MIGSNRIIPHLHIPDLVVDVLNGVVVVVSDSNIVDFTMVSKDGALG